LKLPHFYSWNIKFLNIICVISLSSVGIYPKNPALKHKFQLKSPNNGYLLTPHTTHSLNAPLGNNRKLGYSNGDTISFTYYNRIFTAECKTTRIEFDVKEPPEGDCYWPCVFFECLN
jgi:hypothetical protein